MNKDLADLKPILMHILAWLQRYFKIIIFVIIAILYGFLVWQINALNHREPDENTVNQQIQQVKRPNIDTQTANKLKALEDNSQEIQSLFKAARENPFQE